MHFFGRLGEVVRNPVREMADQIYHFPSSVNQSQSSEGDGQWKVATYAHLHAIHAPRVMVISGKGGAPPALSCLSGSFRWASE